MEINKKYVKEICTVSYKILMKLKKIEEDTKEWKVIIL